MYTKIVIDELNENGWDIVKENGQKSLEIRHKIQVDCIRYILVRHNKLHEPGVVWEKKLFDQTSFCPIEEDRYEEEKNDQNVFVIYVLHLASGYQGVLFIFPIAVFDKLIHDGILINTSNGPRRKLYISREIGAGKWYARKDAIRHNRVIDTSTCTDISGYYRNFDQMNCIS